MYLGLSLVTLLLTKDCRSVPFVLRLTGGGATTGAFLELAAEVGLPVGVGAFGLIPEIEIDERLRPKGGVPKLLMVTEFFDPLLVAGRLVVWF